MNEKIRIAVVDDHSLLRLGIITLLKQMSDVEVIGEMQSGEEAINFVADQTPDLLLMDIVMPGMGGVEATRWIKEQTPVVKIILISSELRKDFISDGIKSGIDGYVSKDISGEELHHAIITVMRGERHFSPEVKALVFQDFFLAEKEGKGLATAQKTTLSKREEEVLKQIATGKSIKEIADYLFISIKTVASHKLHMQEKLGLTNTVQLVKYAISRDLIAIEKPPEKA